MPRENLTEYNHSHPQLTHQWLLILSYSTRPELSRPNRGLLPTSVTFLVKNEPWPEEAHSPQHSKAEIRRDSGVIRGAVL